MSAGRSTVNRKLAVFAGIALVAVLVVSLRYVQIPELLGWGRMSATTTLPQTGGLGPNSGVTYRGVQVGKVTSASLNRDGSIRFGLALDRNAQLPADVRSQVHSTSVIGEQYLELLPTDDSADGRRGDEIGRLANGASIPASRVAPVPVDAGTLLTTVDGLIRSVDAGQLKTTVDELSDAFGDVRQPLSDLLDGSNALVGDAQANLQATRSLIANLEPVLKTQQQVAPDVRRIASNLSSFTGQLAVSDTALRDVISQTPAATEQISAMVTDLHPVLPQVLANLAATGEVLRIYLAGVKQMLVLYPPLVGTLQMIALTAPQKAAPNLDFHININDPQPCRKGFNGVPRTAADRTPSKLKDIGWCKESPTANTAVRGSRNMPCPESSTRSATARGCGYDFTKAPEVTVTSYDPATGRFRGPDGKLYTLDLGKQNRPGTSPYTSGLLQALNS